MQKKSLFSWAVMLTLAATGVTGTQLQSDTPKDYQECSLEQQMEFSEQAAILNNEDEISNGNLLEKSN